MRFTLLPIVLTVPTGCDATDNKPMRPASTSKPRPPASLPMPAKPKPAAPAWKVVSVHDGDTLRAIAEGCLAWMRQLV
jgi:hypothetical protein